MTNGVRFKTYCDFDPSTKRGWTLVARVNGTGNDFTAVSNAWADDSVFNQESAWELGAKTSMKNHGWFLMKNNVIKVCFDGPYKDCALFSHNLGMRLHELFSQEYGVIVEQHWKFDELLKSVGKSCDTSRIQKEWCGINLANICHPEDMNPNLNPTNHIVRIGCIGALSKTCTPGDYALGLGVTSCYDGYGCDRIGPRTASMHWSCPPNYGAFDQTGFIYIN